MLVGLLFFALSAKRPSGIDSIEKLIELPEIVEMTPVERYNERYQDTTQVYEIVYLCDGLRISGFIGASKDYQNSKHPILILNRGGEVDLYRMSPSYVAAWAEEGYVVLASQYRGSGGKSEGTDPFGGDDIHDVTKLVDIGGQLAFADTDNIFMFGVSRGGLMTYGACRDDDRIRAAVSVSGVSDVAALYNTQEAYRQEHFVRMIGGTPEEVPEEYARRSAVNWAEEINVPLMLIHGDQDERVDVSQAILLAKRLEEYGKDFELIVLEGADHEGVSWTDYYDPAARWFAEHKK